MAKILRALALGLLCACHEPNPRFIEGGDTTDAATMTGSTGTSEVNDSDDTAGDSSGTAGVTGGMTDGMTGGPNTGTTYGGSTYDTTNGVNNCGDGVLDPDEACDDGPLNALDADCLPYCEFNVCGDSHLLTGVEGCDDGDFEPHNACNNACQPTPTGLDFMAGDDTIVIGSMNGALVVDECEALIGFVGRTDVEFSNSPSAIAGVCGQLAVGVVDDAFAVKVSASGETLPSYGNSGFDEYLRLCPADHVVVGVTGHDSGVVTKLVFRCAPLTITEEPNGNYTLAVGAAADLAAVGELDGTAADANCPTDQIASGQQIVDNDGLFAAVGLRCSRPSLRY